jgi:hypothetical protein
MTSREAASLKKADVARTHCDKFLQMVRDGRMSAEEYLLNICGVPPHKLDQMRALAGI